MRKIFILSVILTSVFTFAGASAQAASKSESLTTSTVPQRQVQVYRNRNNRVVRTYTTTRLERRGNRVFRVTYQITQRPNGRTVSRMINRVRVR